MRKYKIFTKDSMGRTVLFYRDILRKNMAILAYRVDEVEIDEEGNERKLRRVI